MRQSSLHRRWRHSLPLPRAWQRSQYWQRLRPPWKRDWHWSARISSCCSPRKICAKACRHLLRSARQSFREDKAMEKESQMNLNQDEYSLHARVQEARTSRKTVTSQAGAVGVDLEGAYRIQAALGEKRELKGYKFGLISPAKQVQMGINAPIYGHIYSDMLLEG